MIYLSVFESLYFTNRSDKIISFAF